MNMLTTSASTACKSSIPGVDWPSIPGSPSAQLLAVLGQLEHSQWLDTETLRARQFEQAGKLLEHAWERVPFYRRRLESAGYRPGVAVDEALWAALPLLQRTEIQEHGVDLESTPPLETHGKTRYVKTSGSTGHPIQVLRSDVSQFFWQVMTLREHLWHRRDFSAKLVGIRSDRSMGSKITAARPDWGAPVNLVFASGSSIGLDMKRASIDYQLEWLVEQQPAYLISLASNLRGLAVAARNRGIKINSLREVRAIGEPASTELRSEVDAAWGVPVTDMYSATEVGIMASQCPQSTALHVHAETMLVEVLNEAGHACAPGEVGRIVVTPLHSFAMPLIRYQLGDYAEVGEACPCGRGLPVLRRILGRTRNLMTGPDGRRYFPSFPADSWMHIGNIRQLQLVQTAPERIEVILAASPLTTDQEAELDAALHKDLPYPCRLDFRYVDTIPSSPIGKYEDFVSRVPPPEANA